MSVSDVLEPDGIIVTPPWHTFDETVRGLVENLVARGRIAARLREPAVRAVCEREQVASTAVVEIGVSIPHARVDGITELAAALAVSPTAVYYAMAGVPISIMALVLSPPNLAGEHLNFLSAISMLLQSESLRRRLRQAPDTAAAIAVLRAEERR